jgi:hypothetical protein
MKTTAERKAEIEAQLTLWKTHGINRDGKRIEEVIRYQDLIGHASMAELKEIETGMTEDVRRLFVWANFLCLSYDMALDVFLKTVGSRKIRAAYDAETASLREWEEKIASAEGALHVREFNAKAEIDRANRERDEARQETARIMTRQEEQRREWAEQMASMERVSAETDADNEALRKENADLQAVKRVLAGLK